VLVDRASSKNDRRTARQRDADQEKQNEDHSCTGRDTLKEIEENDAYAHPRIVQRRGRRVLDYDDAGPVVRRWVVAMLVFVFGVCLLPLRSRISSCQHAGKSEQSVPAGTHRHDGRGCTILS
jgi:hypothetical protein